MIEPQPALENLPLSLCPPGAKPPHGRLRRSLRLPRLWPFPLLAAAGIGFGLQSVDRSPHKPGLVSAVEDLQQRVARLHHDPPHLTAKLGKHIRHSRVVDQVVEGVGVVLVVVELLGHAMLEEIQPRGHRRMPRRQLLHRAVGGSARGRRAKHPRAVAPGVEDVAVAFGLHAPHRAAVAARVFIVEGEDDVAARLRLAAEQGSEGAAIEALRRRDAHAHKKFWIHQRQLDRLSKRSNLLPEPTDRAIVHVPRGLAEHVKH